MAYRLTLSWTNVFSYMNYYRCFLAILLLLNATALAGYAQQAVLSLDDCLAYAFQHSSKLQITRANAIEATANYRDAIGQLLPSLSASTSAYINFGRGIDPKTNTYTNTNSFSNGYNIESSLLLFDGLSSIYRLRSSREEQQIGREEQRRAEQSVRMATIEAYYNLLYAKELQRLAAENLDNSIQLTQQIARMHELGMKASTDVAEAQASMATDRQTAISRRNQYEIALLQLKASMNFPIDQPLGVSDSLAYGEVTSTPITPEGLYHDVLAKLPDARIAELQLRSSKHLYQSSIGSFFPNLTLNAGFGSGFSYFLSDQAHESFWDQLSNRRGAYVGATLSFNLFSRLQNSNRVQRAKAQYLAQQAKSDDEKRDVYKAVQEAILYLNSSVEEYNAAVEVEKHRHQVYEATLRNFQKGHASALDLSQASARYKEARVGVAHTYTLYLLRKEGLNYYTSICK